MVKALKNLTYLIFCASLSATIYAMDPPLAGEESSSPPVQTNLLNNMENNNDIRNNILEISGLANCVELAHVSNLELVCKGWYTLINNIFTIIKEKDYNDPLTPSELQNNSSVKHLIIHGSLVDFSILNQSFQENVYYQVIQTGLQNKPHLKTLVFNSSLSVEMLFSYTIGTKNGWVVDHPTRPHENLLRKDTPHIELLNLDHLKCFLHLENLIVKGAIEGASNNDMYFIRNFMQHSVLPNIKLFKYSNTIKKFS
ncbi:MAG: hypothetical protein ACOH2E_00390 [Candidatus Paracaedibacter sp.]